MKIDMSGKKESREREKVHDRGRWTKERWYPLHDDCSQSLLKTISKKIYLTFFLSFRNPPRFSYHYEILSPLPPPSLALFPSLTFTIEPPGFIGKVHLFPCLRLAVQLCATRNARGIVISSSPCIPASPPSVYTAFEKKVKGKISRANFPGWKASFQIRAGI